MVPLGSATRVGEAPFGGVGGHLTLDRDSRFLPRYPFSVGKLRRPQRVPRMQRAHPSGTSPALRAEESCVHREDDPPTNSIRVLLAGQRLLFMEALRLT